MGDLTERLLAVDGGDEGTHWYRNPEGPEAAARIAELEAEVARLREALRITEIDAETMLIDRLEKPDRTAFWTAVRVRNAARAALAAPDTGGAE